MLNLNMKTIKKILLLINIIFNDIYYIDLNKINKMNKTLKIIYIPETNNTYIKYI